MCPVKNLCIAFKENRVAELPNPGKRAAVTARRFIAVVAKVDGRFLVRQRPTGVVNAHLWEFPNAEIFNGDSDPTLVAKDLFGVDPSSIKPICTVKHSITRYRITLDAFSVRFNGFPARDGQVWKTPAQMHRLAFASAHKKILNRLLSP